MNSNFDFLQSEFPVLSTFGCQAEKYCFSDPNSCLMKLGMIGESIVNLMFTYGIDVDKATSKELDELENYIRDQIEKLLDAVKKTNLYFVIVSNEIGMGIVPANKLSRIYSDFVGRANQLIGKYSDEVYFVVSGIPMKVK